MLIKIDKSSIVIHLLQQHMLFKIYKIKPIKYLIKFNLYIL